MKLGSHYLVEKLFVIVPPDMTIVCAYSSTFVVDAWPPPSLGQIQIASDVMIRLPHPFPPVPRFIPGIKELVINALYIALISKTTGFIAINGNINIMSIGQF